MSGFGYIVAGLAAGWMIEWLFDFFYWRKRFKSVETARSTAEEKLKATENVLFLIRQDLSEAEGEIKDYRTKLSKSEQELTSLKTKLEAFTGPSEAEKDAAILQTDDISERMPLDELKEMGQSENPPKVSFAAGVFSAVQRRTGVLIHMLQKGCAAALTSLKNLPSLLKNVFALPKRWFQRKSTARKEDE
jgi:hypothetical protein